MPDLHSLPEGSWPEKAVRNNGLDHLALERYKLRELAEGWPCYRDACEWENLASLFHPDAYIYTTWTGRTHYKDFIEVSKAGMDAGAFIMHRVHGSTTDINLEATRAVTKMKATITQRFTLDGCEVDVEADCRFCYFWEKQPDGKWLAKMTRHWYEKDKMIPADPRKVPALDDSKLALYPAGYRFLAYFQEATMGVKVLMDMPGHRRSAGDPNDPCGQKHDLLYRLCKKWVEGEDIDKI